MIRHIPNTLTLANLFCGCAGIVQVFQGNLPAASYLIILAAVFDFFDGFAAKMLHAASAIGKDLDSLADMVTFGALPSFMVFNMLQAGFEEGSTWPYGAFAIALFSALRLARFNNDARQRTFFIGVPTPANAMLIASFPHLSDNFRNLLTGNPWVLLALTLVLAALLVAELPLLALKFRGFGWKGNESRFLLMGISVVLLAILQWDAVPMIMLVYLGLSVLNRRKIYAEA